MLSALPPEPLLATAVVQPGALPSPSAIRVLVAEDNEINCQVITAQLGLLGLTAEVAENGEAALVRWRQGGFQLLVTDLQMPVMDGFALAASVRSEERAPARIPIIALTANASQEEATRCAAAGMDDCLTKPIKLAALEATLERLLGRRRGTAANVSRASPVSPPQRRRQPGVRQPVDAGVLAAVFRDDPSRLDGLFKQFASEAAATAVALAFAVKAGGRGEAGAIAHRLKAAARSVGARRLGNLCAHIETADGAGDAVALAASLSLFRDEVEALGRWVAARDASASYEQEPG